jgi:hypothetical protein
MGERDWTVAMKYWAYLVAKVIVAGGFLYGLRWIVGRTFPAPDTFMYVHPDPFAHDLAYTFVMLLYWMIAAGIGWTIIWDQSYRCRSCLRRLRMPIHRGSWTHVLFGPPETEYICPYGHGTLVVADLQITGRQPPDWEPHEDMWKELLSLEETKK